ncbi:MAG: sigma-70 family RNA polymerase sigma factor [Proteobacteria bacterium]|nr:sigma-70 family RNA polymerase sigma factor [Pseudomonadota bacterium]
MALPVLADSLDSYLVEVSRFPMLSREEERELSIHYLDTKDVGTAQRLVTSHLRFVVKTALEYRNYGIALKDLVQEGNLGLMNAVKKFNPHKGYRLITYAVWWIKSFIQEYILKTKGIVKRSSKALKKKLFYKTAIADGKAAKDASKDAANILTTNDLSLDAPIGEGEDRTHLDMMIDPDKDQASLVADNQEREINKDKVSSALALLNDKERFIIMNRQMSDDALSLQNIGDRYGISRERVRQIEKAAMGKLKKVLARELPAGRAIAELPA